LPYIKENYGISLEYVDALRDFLNSQANLYEESDNDELEFLPNNKKPDEINGELHDYEKTFSRKYKNPSELDDVDFPNHRDERIRDDEDDDYTDDEIIGGSGFPNTNPIDKSIIDSLADQSGMYTEGGTIVPLRRDIIRPGEKRTLYS
jgi:hypothetical protein